MQEIIRIALDPWTIALAVLIFGGLYLGYWIHKLPG